MRRLTERQFVALAAVIGRQGYLMDEAAAWRAIAAKLLNEERVEYGLCDEIERLRKATQIARGTARRMRNQIITHLGSSTRYAWPRGGSSEERAMFALWLAEETRHPNVYLSENERKARRHKLAVYLECRAENQLSARQEATV